MERIFFNNIVTDDETFIIKFSNHSFGIPSRTPMECRKQGEIYNTSLFIDVEIFPIIDGEEQSDPIRKYKWRVCEFPVMLGSSICRLYNLTPQERMKLGECDDDPLGYFIIRGHEKNIVCQEKLMTNIIVSKEKTISSKTFSIVECRSVKKTDGLSQVSLRIIDGVIHIFFTDKAIHLKDFLEYSCRLKGVNYEEVKLKFLSDMKQADMSSVMVATLTGKQVKGKGKAIQFEDQDGTENQKTSEFFEKRDFDQTFLPHINKFENKIEFLLLMVKELLKSEFGLKPLTNRDSYNYKRLEPVGTLINQLFSKLFSNMCNEANRNLQASDETKIIGRRRRKRLAFNPEVQKIDSILNSKRLQKELDQSFVTSNWWASGLEAKSGVVVMLEATNRIRQIANLRKISVGNPKAFSKIVKARKIDPSSSFLICLKKGTKITISNHTEKNVEDIKDGDEVLTVDPETLEITPSKVYNHFCKYSDEPLFKISTIDGKVIEATPEHKFLTNNGWVEAKDLRNDDLLAIYNNNYNNISNLDLQKQKDTKVVFVPIENIERTESQEVYDFTTESENHSMISNNYVSHNCPSYITEGETSGLVKELALSAYITLNEEDDEITSHMKNLRTEFPGSTICFINGRYSGKCNGEIVKMKMLELRRSGKISPYTCISLSHESDEVETTEYLKIFTVVGRIVRPLIIVGDRNVPIYMYKGLTSNDILNMTVKDLINNGIIEFVDAMESEYLHIAMTPEDLDKSRKFTHLEINPSWMFGVIANLQNFPQHMPGPRGALTTGKIQQQIGAPFLNYLEKGSDAKVLWYPQKPLMRTEMYESLIKMTKEQVPEIGSMIPSAQNVVIAIMPYLGFNVDDAIIINRRSLDYGLFRSDTYEIEEFDIENSDTATIIPNRTPIMYKPQRRETILYPAEAGTGFTSKFIYSKERVDEMLRYGKDSTTNFGIESIEELGKLVREFESNSIIYYEFERTFTMKQHIKHGDILAKYDVSEVISKTEKGNVRKRVHAYAGYEGDIENVEVIGEGIRKRVRIRIKTHNITEQGDKLLAPYAQKGVTGIVVDPEDLPFDPNTGIIPDLIISPSAFPSRMTIGMLLDIVMSKSLTLGSVSKLSGEEILTPIFDEIPSTSIHIKDYSSKLKSIIEERFPTKYSINDKLSFKDVEDIKQIHPRISIQNSKFDDFAQWQKDLYNFIFPLPSKSDTIGYKSLTINQHRSWRKKILQLLDIKFPLKEDLTYESLNSDQKKLVEKFYSNINEDQNKEIISDSSIIDMKYPIYNVLKSYRTDSDIKNLTISTEGKGIYTLEGDDLAIYWIKHIEKKLPRINSSAFAKPNYEDFVDFMKHFGETEKVRMINGMTGELMDSTITMGVTSYYVLKHMAKDKMRARDTGKRDAMNKQAIKGKTKGGAVRLGEMECAVMKAHGSAEFLRERMRDVSDITTIFVCENCQQMCYTDNKGHPKCEHCRSLDLEHTISRSHIPYSLCMLYHYNTAMGIATKMTMEKTRSIMSKI